MKEKPDITCIILAGGASVRFGGDKGLARLHGRPLIAHVVDKLRAQTSGIVGINAAANSPYVDFADIGVPDIAGDDLGPLAGLHAALSWAESKGLEQLVTCAIDTPFLPDDLILRLSEADGPAIAASLGRCHPVCGIWPTGLLRQLEQILAGGERAVQKWMQACGACEVAFAAEAGRDPFLNINTREDLEAASKL